MKKYYVWDEITKIYAGNMTCKNGKNPQNSTEIEPLPHKANNEIVWSGEGWTYKPMKDK